MGHLNPTYEIDGFGKPVATIEHAGQHVPVSVDILSALLLGGGMLVATDYLANLGNGASRDYLIVVGNTQGTHIGISYMSGGDTLITIFRDTTHTGGNALVEFNRNQNVADGAPNIAITQGPAGGADGNAIFTALIPGGVKVNSSPGGGRASAFGWIFESNTSYLVRATNVSGAINPISTQFDIHVHA